MRFCISVLLALFLGVSVQTESMAEEQTVYVTRTGQKYHRSDCRTLRRSKYLYEMTRDEALQKGYLPCKVCRPDYGMKRRADSADKAYSALCIEVTDGDTVKVKTTDGEIRKIRLYGIDSPEQGQIFGKIAKKELEDMIFLQDVEVYPHETDKYGRTAALVTVNGKTVQKKLLQAGLAWVYPQYCNIPLCGEFYRIQEQAREKKKGIWEFEQSASPWEWRKLQ